MLPQATPHMTADTDREVVASLASRVTLLEAANSMLSAQVVELLKLRDRFMGADDPLSRKRKQKAEAMRRYRAKKAGQAAA